METFLEILIPFLGTTLGASCVFFIKKSLDHLITHLPVDNNQAKELKTKLKRTTIIMLAVGATLYVVVEELIPKISQWMHSNIGPFFSAMGRSMMMLDVALE